MNIASLGWGEALAESFQPHADAGLRPGRVAIQHRGAYVLLAEEGEVWANVSGRLRHAADSTADLPAVGDWVAYDCPPGSERAGIQAILPRRSAFRRKQAGHETAEQVVAANVDVLYLVTSLNQDLNVRRIERYMTLAWESGADPVVVLTKADLCPDVEPALALVESVTFGVPVHVTSAPTGAGFDGRPRSPRRRPHGCGGRLVGRRQVDPHQRALRRGAARDQRDPRRRPRAAHDEPPRADRPSRHRLRHRHARECASSSSGTRPRGSSGRSRTSTTVIVACRFSDCGHDTEPGCAVRAALADGSLDAERFQSYQKLQRELHYLEIRHDARARSEERKRWRAINKEARARARP